MDEIQKSNLLQNAKTHLTRVSALIFQTKTSVDNTIALLRKELIRARGEERDTKEILLYHHLDRAQNMTEQHASPYFVRCDVAFDDEPEEKTLYFGKFQYIPESIYSWVAPAASIRFESPGKFSYTTPSGEERSGTLLRKDQFMIVNQKILFMSSESTDIPRELIYQEYFSQKKSEFLLKDIVEQMEKAQDTIIRSHYYGSFLISGAAGSGKTTLALHRAAYLIQSPDTAPLFSPKNVIIFVNDQRTKEYFSSLLPQLGIHKVTITTFYEWAMRIAGLQDREYVFRFGRTEQEKDAYEYAKNNALQSLVARKTHKDMYKTLADVYKPFFTDEQKKLFALQKEGGFVDRFDLTVLLKLMLAEKGQVFETIEKFVRQVNGRYVKRIFKQPVQYSLIVLDEAENYLAEQIMVLKSAVNNKTNGMIYVGDLVQRTLPFTITDWQEVQETFAAERKIVLQKVYRNTRQVLTYIASLGYIVTIPDTIQEGKAVEEYIVANKDEEIQKILSMVKERKETLIGVLAKSEEYLEDFKKHLSQYKNVHVLTINEAQGVEFDTVFLVGIDQTYFGVDGLPAYLQQERKRVDRDLIYVALTRAMNELYVLGTIQLKTLLSK